MQITPAVGIPEVSIGDSRSDVESRLGEPSSSEEGRAFYFDREPNFSVHYDGAGTVELIEVVHGEGAAEAFLGEIQLTFRLMDDVVEDLEIGGFTSRPVDIGRVYDAGFCVFSMASRDPSELVDGAKFDEDDERLVVEGVSIAPASYWRD
ncbi:2-amino-3-ketobutyrate coenzyme A ligase [Janibacter sp. HTCC2649]|uniref:2-amino-3-ketobutyrate CoA ligase n=1 Tax=Janibacter sp. HTCC2649 TaxID=313589 RepID=UPI0000670D50|nr:2-amino-3-ketobutyrate CoA ligase [Janibacter sp. HTCC2649]EAQ00469.1 2-amino-3-ketobutyrate coenzyme A ligase [Janibacter sp. HTCC2649]